MSGSNLSEGFWCGQNIFSNIKKIKNSTNKQGKKLQKLIKEVQKKKSKTEKNKGCTYMSRSIECAHRKYEKVFTKNKAELQNTRIHSILFWTREMLLKFIIGNIFHVGVFFKFPFKGKGG